MYWKPPPSLRRPMTQEFIDSEPEDEKALRWLRSFRHFVKSKRYSVMCVQLDGETLLIIKAAKAHLPENADLTTSIEG